MPAAPLPPGMRYFPDINGAPLVEGTVEYCIPGGLTPKDTWQDYDQGTKNSNPLTLDARGMAPIWGVGRYREIVRSKAGDLIYDRETAVFADRPYEAGFYFIDTPAAGDEIMRWNFTQTVTFLTDFEGSVGSVPSSGWPSVDTDFDICNGPTVIGAMTITTLGVVTFLTTVTDPQFVPQDVLRVVVQSGGANGAQGISATFLGQLG